MNSVRTAWIRERATSFVCARPDSLLTDSERAALDQILDGASCVAIGEATHGSRTILQSIERLLRFLIEERQAGILILESCLGATQSIDRYVTHGEGTAQQALAKIGNWNYCSQELLGFVTWLRDYNRGRSDTNRPVRLFGCDCQSIDGPKAQLLRLLRGFAASGVLSNATVEETSAVVGSLPTDRDLGKFVELILRPAESIETRVAEIEAWQSDFVSRNSASMAEVSRRLSALQQALPSTVSQDDSFMFERCGRSLEQVIDFYSPGDATTKRDAFMAENILAIQRHLEPHRMIVLSHNVHVAREPLVIRGYNLVGMGHHLASALGEGYRAIGSAIYEGQYLASAEYRPEDNVVENAHPARLNSFESLLQELLGERETHGLLVDFSSSRQQSPWPNGIETRLGESGKQESYEDCFFNQRPELQFDGMLFVKTTTPITILPEYFDRAVEQWRPEGA
jgi:erythromycin esterase-like protein